MDGELLRWLYHRLVKDRTANRTRYCTYSDGLIALVGLFAVMSNRSARWASVRANWPAWQKRPLPSYSQLRRRLATPSVATLLRQLNEQLTDHLGRSNHKAADGKPLVVGGFTKDRDATRGHVPGGFARGYRLHAVRDGVTGVIDVAAVTGLADGEASVLRPMLRRTDLRGCLLRADANYDSNALYALTASRGGRLIAPRRKRGRGLGHHPQHPDRLKAIAELEHDPEARQSHRRWRADIERGFADLCNRTGLFALPPFVRRLTRVRRWVRAKLLLYHLRLVLDQTQR
jgi:hypothetical protein